jgi:hypothetical protein
VGVFDQQHHRILGSEAFEEQPPPGEQLFPRQRLPSISLGDHAEQPAQPHPHIPALTRIGHVPGQSLFQLGRRGLGRVLLGDG